MQRNDLILEYRNHHYFKSAVGFFLFFLPQMLKRKTSALLPITIWYACKKQTNLPETNG